MNVKSVLTYLLLLFVLAIASASATPITLTDPTAPNSTVRIDANSDLGLYDWLVEGTDHATQDWYWYRIGGTGQASAINTISTPTIGWSAAAPYVATITYANSSLEFKVTYVLTGAISGFGTSDVSETVTVKNKTSSALDLHVFEYSNFDLGQTPNNDTAWHVDSSHIMQQDGAVTANQQQTGVNPAASHWEISTNGTLLNKLRNLSFLNLADTSTPLTGDVEYAFQWDFSIQKNSSSSISKDKLIEGSTVPEPSALFVLATGLAAAIPIRRRKR